MKQLLSLKIPGMEGEIQAPSGVPTGGLSQDGGRIIGFLLGGALFLAVIASFGFIIWGGYNFITSQGDKGKLESARKTIVFSIIGLLICFLSFFAITLVGGALGVDFFNISL